ncbi:hypothetical protein AtNW77_Chr4g0297511 [Arabidopsis thaliana]|uniref:Uncharacterized protein n=3 Tax=Arabidopsis TaxID=3701 RepID=A0A178UXV5_ARATH|nr:hypothetical protein ISN45_At04g022180 [Arabidopsis thaliana x Arabidopsis arenosa]KAG7621260.1 hypothetical protein ISN44_As04g021740 [Arabidopsis suecica]OAO98445.1 hypothetical protein AXX17_AT4G24560 [Arabidopsis thaliana]
MSLRCYSLDFSMCQVDMTHNHIQLVLNAPITYLVFQAFIHHLWTEIWEAAPPAFSFSSSSAIDKVIRSGIVSRANQALPATTTSSS